MDSCGRLVDSSQLAIQCRRCGFADTDDYEVVKANSVQSMRCAGCANVFHFTVIECTGCGGETLFAWATEPAAQDLQFLVCAACERRSFDEIAGTISFA